MDEQGGPKDFEPGTLQTVTPLFASATRSRRSYPTPIRTILDDTEKNANSLSLSPFSWTGKICSLKRGSKPGQQTYTLSRGKSATSSAVKPIFSTIMPSTCSRRSLGTSDHGLAVGAPVGNSPVCRYRNLYGRGGFALKISCSITSSYNPRAKNCVQLSVSEELFVLVVSLTG